MGFIVAIIFIVLSDAVYTQDFNSRTTFMKATNANSVHQQSGPNAYLTAFNNRLLKNFQPFQIRNFQQKNITNYAVQWPSSIYTPLNINSSTSGQPLSTPYSTSQPNNQQSLIYVQQSFRESYNPQLNQQLNCSKSTCSTLQPLLFSSSPKPFRSVSRTGKVRTVADAAGETNNISTGNEDTNDVDEEEKYSTGVPFPPPPPRTPPPRAPPPPPPSRTPPPPPPPPRTPPPIIKSAFTYLPPGVKEEDGRGYSLGYPEKVSGYPGTGVYSPASEYPLAAAGGYSPAPYELHGPETGTTETTQIDDDLNHPPHIHNLDVECSKTMMTINIEFNRVFDGIIYSKGYYTNPECTYVKQNSGLTRYSFTVNLDFCGTQFINNFEDAGQAYLENVLVLQNEPDVQEVWDTVRSVRCLWEGNINKFLTMNLSVNMLNQEIVTFSGDTATAKLDIQIGKGPFAPAADGLVKIGETMTLVVSVGGDPGFDLQVRDCVARDEASTNMLQLTDERGCILKPKLFGAFQKTKDTGNTGASIIAYAFFQAFKFPDAMDLFIECNVELCKTNCEPCPEVNQQIEPRRRRRSVTYAPSSSNSTNSVLLSDPVRVGRHFKVIMLDDLSIASSKILDNMEETTIEMITKTKEICMSNSGFYTTFSLMLSTLFIAIMNASVLYIKLQRIRKSKFIDC